MGLPSTKHGASLGAVLLPLEGDLGAAGTIWAPPE